jgi:predicted phage-related endonuclease
MTLGKLTEVAENVEEAAELEAATADVFEIADWVARLEKLRAMKKDVEEREKEAADFIKAWLRERNAEFGAVDGQLLVRRRTVTSRRIDTTALRAKEPEIAEQFTKESTSERLEMIGP